MSPRGIRSRWSIWSNEESGTVGSRSHAGRHQAGGPRPSVTTAFAWPMALRKIGGDPTRLAESRMPARIVPLLSGAAHRAGRHPRESQASRSAWSRASSASTSTTSRFAALPTTPEPRPCPSATTRSLAAARLIEAVQEIVTREPGRQVGTVGRLEVSPNAPNVVPGLVRHSIELRDLSAEKIARLGTEIQARAQADRAGPRTRTSR